MSAEVLIDQYAVMDLFKISRKTLYKWRNKKSLNFPKEIMIENKMYFDKEEIFEFIRTKKEQRA